MKLDKTIWTYSISEAVLYVKIGQDYMDVQYKWGRAINEIGQDYIWTYCMSEALLYVKIEQDILDIQYKHKLSTILSLPIFLHACKLFS